MTIKPRGRVNRSNDYVAQIGGIEPQIEIAAWCPDDKAQMPPEQIHFKIHLPGLSPIPLVVRFKSPDTIGFIIEELIRYRKLVWPSAQPIDPASRFDPDDATNTTPHG